MKTAALSKLIALTLLVLFGGIVLHAPFIVGMETLFPQYELFFKSWKELLMIVAAVLTAWLLWQKRAGRNLLGDRILQVSGVYIGLHLLTAAAFLTGLQATVAGLMIDLRYVLFFVLVYVFLKIQPHYKNIFIKVGAIGAVIVVGFGVLQLFLPADILKHIGYSKQTIQPYLTVDENPDYIRINSTMRGPNPLGAYVVIVLSLITALLVSGKVLLRDARQQFLTGVAIVSSLAVLWASYSRSAVLGAGLAVFLVIIVSARHLISRRVWIIGCVVLFALAGGILLGRDHSFVTNVILHENREGGSEISSNDGHIESLIDGTERMLRQPVGAGIGSTGSASLFTDRPLIIENQYLFIAHEVGWLGLVLFMTLMYFVLHSLWRKRHDWLSLGVFASGIGLGAIGLLQPVWVDDTVAIVWWGLAAISLASGGDNVRKTHKKAK